jgi:hypothetical protein
MLDFRRNAVQRNALGQRERQRLLLLALMLGMALVLTGMVADPTMLRWFEMLASHASESSQGVAIDNRLDMVARKETLPDVFVAKNDQPPANLTPMNLTPASEDELFSGIKLSDFTGVVDDTPSRHDEQACSLHLFDVLDRTDPGLLRKASVGLVTYAQLFRQPKYYRGRVVTVSGLVRRVNRVALPKNEYGIEAYYQVWLWLPDNPTSPLVAYCHVLPQDFPIGQNIAEQAEMTGFFFKRWAYLANDVPRTAPMILTQTLRWQRKQPAARQPVAPRENWAIPLVVCVAGLFALAAAWYVYLHTRPMLPPLPEITPNFDAIQPVDDKPHEAEDRP